MCELMDQIEIQMGKEHKLRFGLKVYQVGRIDIHLLLNLIFGRMGIASIVIVRHSSVWEGHMRHRIIRPSREQLMGRHI